MILAHDPDGENITLRKEKKEKEAEMQPLCIILFCFFCGSAAAMQLGFRGLLLLILFQ